MDIDVKDHGATGTGADDTAAFEAACAAAQPGDRIKVGPGRFGLTRTILPRCIVEGGDRVNSTVFNLGGAAPLFKLTVPGSGILDLGLEGNGIYPGDHSVSQTGAIEFGAYDSEAGDFRIEGNRLAKFNADYWLLGRSFKKLTNSKVSGNYFAADTPDCQNGVNGNFLLAFYGGLQGGAFDSEVNRNVIQGDYVNNGLCLFGKHHGFALDGNQINRMSAQVNNDWGYGIALYALGETYESSLQQCPKGGVVTGNRIAQSNKAGVYCATAMDTTISVNSFLGQSSGNDGGIPRGAVALNGCANMHVDGNNIQDCFYGVNVAGPNTYDLFLTGNRVRTSNGGSPVAFRLRTALTPHARIVATNNDSWMMSGSAASWDISMLTGGAVVIRNNQSRSYSHGLTDTNTATWKISENIHHAP